MGLVSNLAQPRTTPVSNLHPLCDALLHARLLDYDGATAAQKSAKRKNLLVEKILHHEHGISQDVICNALAELYGIAIVDPRADVPDPRLVSKYGVKNTLKYRLLPWRRCGAVTIVLCASPDDFERNHDSLTAYLGPVRMALCTPHQINEAVRDLRDMHLINAAETQLMANASSRSWNSRKARRTVMAFGLLGLTLFITAPITMVGIFCLFMSGLLILNTLLKLAATIAGWRSAQQKPPQSAALPVRLPTVTLLVPLFKEKDIAAHLIRRLSALDYPRALLDVCLVLEAGDDTTQAAIAQTDLPSWIRPIVVPNGTLKTKPRALNYAMTFAHGSIIGVYDAEDAPARDQLRVVAHHFANARQDVACLQGTLDYYNSTSNWLTRCFTLEYASWFRVVLPGFARLGLVVPLGGTTLFFRREVLEKLGGWDAHNVTEDADLGVRLARQGYRTEFMRSVTEEEANGRMWPWIKQRSRWLKGYAITYAVHMRQPMRLWQDLGAWRFFGVQMLFLGTLLQFALAPVIWSFWLMPFGLAHPLQAVAPTWLIWTIAVSFIVAGFINLCILTIGAKRAGKLRLAVWAPTLQLYFPLAVAAVYKGLAELLNKPFYWDKTTHGVLMPVATPPPQQPLHPVSGAPRTPH